jgi:hypothetical protein
VQPVAALAPAPESIQEGVFAPAQGLPASAQRDVRVEQCYAAIASPFPVLLEGKYFWVTFRGFLLVTYTYQRKALREAKPWTPIPKC